MIIAALDTNILATGIASVRVSASLPGEVFRQWVDECFTLVTSEHILSELAATLVKPYFRARVVTRERARFQTLIRRQAILTPILNPLHGVASHEEDDAVIATAVDGRADFLVTGDADLLRLGQYASVRVITARAFLGVLGVPVPERGSE